MVSKTSQKRKHVDHVCFDSISNLNEYIPPCRRVVCVLVFGTFLKPSTQLQTTRSLRLLNGFWCFLVQNEEEVLLASFLFSTAHFCWIENNENFDSSKKVRFVQVFFTNVVVSAELECQQKILENPGNNAYCRIRRPETFLYLPKPTPHQISRQTEHLAMCASGARKSASGTRNEPTYRWVYTHTSLFQIKW